MLALASLIGLTNRLAPLHARLLDEAPVALSARVAHTVEADGSALPMHVLTPGNPDPALPAIVSIDHHQVETYNPPPFLRGKPDASQTGRRQLENAWQSG